jgi:hypothetical protein
MAHNTKPRYDDLEEDENEGLTDSQIDYVKKLAELLERVEPLIYQINSSYNQYIAGAELHPPNERRGQLEQMMNTIMLMSKPTPSYRFRYQSVLGTYNTYRKRWDKLIMDLESGKIKRVIPTRKRYG